MGLADAGRAEQEQSAVDDERLRQLGSPGLRPLEPLVVVEEVGQVAVVVTPRDTCRREELRRHHVAPALATRHTADSRSTGLHPVPSQIGQDMFAMPTHNRETHALAAGGREQTPRSHTASSRRFPHAATNRIGAPHRTGYIVTTEIGPDTACADLRHSAAFTIPDPNRLVP